MKIKIKDIHPFVGKNGKIYATIYKGGNPDDPANYITARFSSAVLEWHNVGDALEADVTMDGVICKAGDRVTFDHNYLPKPVIDVDYEINELALAISRKLGNTLDSTSAEKAARKILEKLDELLAGREEWKKLDESIIKMGKKNKKDKNGKNK